MPTVEVGCVHDSTDLPELFCPMMRLCDEKGTGSYNVFAVQGTQPATYCLGCDCMMWINVTVTDDGFRGYCGLIPKPPHLQKKPSNAEPQLSDFDTETDGQ